MQHTRKSKTPQGIEPRPNKVGSATTGVFCFFVVAVRAKAKPGGTSRLFPQEKKTPPHLAATLSRRKGTFLDTRLKLEDRTTGFPEPRHCPQHCIDR